MLRKKKHSPLKDKPLRNPGQSVEEQLEDFLYYRIFAPGIVALVIVVLAGVEWLKAWLKVPPSPRIYSVAAGVAVAYAIFQIWRAWPQLLALRLGRDGERAVGQYLERLRGQGCQVLHDVVGDGFNIDHVVIGRGGVYSIETKTFSKRIDGTVLFDGKSLKIAGYKPDRDPIVQGKAQARWLKQLLSESTGRNVFVRPVVLFPGWFVEAEKGALNDVWVLNPKALPQFLANEQEVLSEEDVRLLAFHLSRFIRQS